MLRRPTRQGAARLAASAIIAAAATAGSVAACSSDDGTLGPVPLEPIGAVIDDSGIPGSGSLARETRDVAGFNEVLFRSEGAVLVTTGENESLSIEADDNLLQYLAAETVDGRLDIRTIDDVNIAPSASPVFTITVPELAGLELAGAGSVRIDAVTGQRLHVRLTGAGDISIDLVQLDELSIDLRGVGTLTVAGTADVQSAYVSGVTVFAAADLTSRVATIEADGNGAATVTVTDNLTARATSNGTIEYYGTPSSGDQEATGSAAIVDLGDRQG